MGVQTIVQVGGVEPSAEAQAEALAKAAETAPTSMEEAQAQIAAAAEAAAAPKAAAPTTPAERPEHVPEKFWDAEKGVADYEALARSYMDLEKKLGAPKADAEEEAAKDDEKTPADDEAPKGAEVMEKLNSTWAEKGELSEEDYALAQKAFGVDKTFVDQYIAGQTALAEAATKRINDAGGGEEAIQSMYAWAATSLDAKAITEFNAVMEGEDVNAAVIAMEQLKTKYEVANGRDPKLLGGKPGDAAVDAYGSWAEVTADMDDPRYAKDPAYRKKVEQKLSRSNNMTR